MNDNIAQYEEYGNTITVDTDRAHILFPKHFALVKRGDKTFFRNYGRPLKNGKGINIVDAEYALVENGLKFSPFIDLYEAIKYE
jgi:hypothetical protein